MYSTTNERRRGRRHQRLTSLPNFVSGNKLLFAHCKTPYQFLPSRPAGLSSVCLAAPGNWGTPFVLQPKIAPATARSVYPSNPISKWPKRAQRGQPLPYYGHKVQSSHPVERSRRHDAPNNEQFLRRVSIIQDCFAETWCYNGKKYGIIVS